MYFFHGWDWEFDLFKKKFFFKSKKIKKIVSVWNDKLGVVSLHCFQSVIPSEAYTREAAMIDALGNELIF